MRVPSFCTRACAVAFSLGSNAEAQPAAVGEAAARSSGITVHWLAPAGCSSSEAIERSVRARVGVLADSTELHVEARVSNRASGFAVAVDFAGAATGLRRLEAPDCERLAEATALIVALTIDPAMAATVAEAPLTEAAAEPPAPLSAKPAAIEKPGASVAAPSPSSKPWQVLLGAGATLDGLLGPHWGGGPAASLGVRGDFLRFDLRAQSMLGAGQAFALPGASPVEASFSGLVLGARACAERGPNWLELGVCGGIESDWIAARADLVDSSPTTSQFFAASAGVLVGYRGSRPLGFSLSVDAVVPFAPPSFVVERGQETLLLYSVAPLGMRAVAAVEFSFEPFE